jgi:peptide/nickel transport system substrate-binding protein
VRALRTSRVARWASLLAVLALVVAACGGDTATTTTAAEPTTTEGPSEPTTTAAPPETTVGECPDVFCVKYNIHPDAAWSDGTPVTSDDFAFTFETSMNPVLDITDREGYNKITGYEAVDDKTIVFAFNEIYAPWQSLFDAVMPKHVLEDQPFNSIWDDGISVGSGPFIFVEWVPDEHILLQRNPDYWASEERASGLPLGDVQEIQVVFIEDSQTMVGALRGQEVDFINPQPQVSLVEDVSGIDGVEFEATLGPVWEHFDFNQDDARLQNLYVRQAIAQGINRDAIVETVVRSLNPDASALGNSVWLNTSAYYEDHFNTLFPYDPVAAEALLTDNGCTRGGDGIYECGGERLSFTWATTAGNEGRELQFELAQADLAAIGIEVTAKFGPASQVFADEHIYGGADQWQIFNFAWVGSPEPAGGNTLYYCEGDAPNGFGSNNNLRYCNEEVDALIKSTDSIVDPAERAAVYNEADALFLADVPMIPMYQKPSFLAWNSEIQNVMPNANNITDTWNIGAWSGKEVITFGAEQQPESMNAWEPDGNLLATSFWFTPVIEGAYNVTPDGRFVPWLIESAEAIVPEG